MRLFRIFLSRRKAFLPLLILAALTTIYLNGTIINNGMRGSMSGYGLDGNSSYLFDVGYAWKEGNINDFLFNGQDVGGVSSQYYTLFENNDYRAKYGLTDAWSDRAYYQELIRLSENALESFQSYQVQSRSQWLQSSLEGHFKKQSYAKLLKTPAAIIGAVVALYSGKAFSFGVGESAMMSARTLKYNSKLTGAAMGVSGLNGLSGGVELSPGGTPEGVDPYRANVSKAISGIGTTAGVTYGLQNQDTTLSLAKNITRYVDLKYDHATTKTGPTNHVIGVGVSAGF